MIGRKLLNLVVLASVLLVPAGAYAGFAETLPMNLFLLDEAVAYSMVDTMYDNSGDKVPLIEEVVRYEPGGGKQGVLIPKPEATYLILINRLQYGILDDLSIGIGIPVVLRSTVDPNFSWEEGDYQKQIGRKYTHEDFWAWAESMGQERPGKWTGNEGVLSDIVLALRYKWTHRIDALRNVGFHSALTVLGAIPTGNHADPEEIVSVGTSLWDLNTQGDLAFHLGFDKDFKKELDDRLTLGIDVFYEVFFDRTLTTPTGENHPLLLTYAPYVGETYSVNPGDFSGVAFQVDVVPYKGPAWGTWLVDGYTDRARQLPGIFAFYLRYQFVHMQQSDWKSDFPLWDYEREKLWKPGYKNFLEAQVIFSFMRLGAPLQVYANVKTLSLIPGKNSRAADVYMGGIRIPMKFW